ncbi:unnamed protein product [Rhizophagus irregularis]|nr:unnamed protein product [Rhizophagus irregularis]
MERILVLLLYLYQVQEITERNNISEKKQERRCCKSFSVIDKKRKAVSDECNVQGKGGQESPQSNKRDQMPKLEGCYNKIVSNSAASSSQSGISNTIVPVVPISAITAAASSLKALLDNSPLASLNPKYRASAPAKKRNDLNYVSSITSKKSDTIKEIDTSGIPEVVLSVAFYNQSNPLNRSQKQPSKPYPRILSSWKPTTNSTERCFLLLNALNSPEEKKSGGYFFIEDVFYNDCRDKNALDYSKTIVEWVNKNERYTHPGLGLYQRKNMDEVTFSDLSIRLNQPYLFVHKGDCEHAIVFTDLRLWHTADGLDANMFPKAIFKCRIIRHKCRMCITRPATLVSINDFMAGETPAYFCDKCYNEYHYDSNSNLLYDNFKVFRYAHD